MNKKSYFYSYENIRYGIPTAVYTNISKIGCYCTFVPPSPYPFVIDNSSWRNAAESFTVVLTLTLGGTKVQ